MTRTARGAARADLRFAVVITATFAGLVAIGMSAHEIWRDEWQAWLLARGSDSFATLLYNMRYEGHPAAWHVMLYGISRLTSSVVAMQVLHLVLAAAAIWTLVRHAPFTRLQKALIVFGYFPAYEFAVISRNYALGMLALFGACAAWSVRQRSFLPLSLWLALLVQSSIYGIIIAFAFGVALAVEWIADPAARPRQGRHRLSAAIGAGLVVVSTGVAIEQIRPPVDADFSGHPAAEEASRKSRADAARSVALIPPRVFVPLPRFKEGVPVWNETMIVEDPGLPGAALVGLLIGLGFVPYLARRPAAVALLATGALGLLLFALELHYGKLRHHGHLLLLIVAAFWIAGLPGREPRLSLLAGRARAFATGLFTLVLGIHVATFAILWTADLFVPFTQGESAARTLAAEGARNGVPVAAVNTAYATTLSGYLDVPIRYLDDRATGTFVVWGRGRAPTPPDSIVERALGEPAAGRNEVLLATDRPLTPSALASRHRIEPLPRDDDPHMTTERFYLYRIRRRGS